MSGPALRGLLIDWGGVLTGSMDAAMRAWALADGVDLGHLHAVMRGWVAPAAEQSPAHRLELGELPPAEFERLLAAELSDRGSVVPATGLLDRMLGGLTPLQDDMIGLVRRARAGGVRTALLSNSWGDHYQEALWDGLFDAVVISGRVGMRKPEAQIFVHTAGLLGLTSAQCVMVDDLAHNVTAAVQAGMVGILHHSYQETLLELEALLGIPLSSRTAGTDPGR